MALDSFQRLLDFRLPKTKNIVFRHDHKEPKHERSQLKFPPFCLLLALVLWNVATERTRYPAVWWEICLSPATKDSCFSKCYMRIGQLIMTRRTGHKSEKYFRSSAFWFVFVLFIFWPPFIVFSMEQRWFYPHCVDDGKSLAWYDRMDRSQR